jgi:hypothetical protein
LYCPELAPKHQRPHDIEPKVRAHLTRIPLFATTFLWCQRLAEPLNNAHHARLVCIQ